MRIRRLLGTALTVLMLIGGLLLVTAGPAAACSYPPRPASEASYAARADAIFVGTLVSRVDRIDRIAAAARAELARERQRRPYRADRVTELMRQVTQRSGRAVLTFKVRRVYKGAVGKHQEVVAFLGPCARPRSGDGPFLIFASKPSPAMSRQYQLNPGQYTFSPGTRALADGGEPELGRSGWLVPNSFVVGVAVLAAGTAAGLALATRRTRRRPKAT